jgi:hypothetical protein
MLRHSPPCARVSETSIGDVFKMGITRKDVCRLHNSWSGVFTGQGLTKHRARRPGGDAA